MPPAPHAPHANPTPQAGVRTFLPPSTRLLVEVASAAMLAALPTLRLLPRVEVVPGAAGFRVDRAGLEAGMGAHFAAGGAASKGGGWEVSRRGLGHGVRVAAVLLQPLLRPSSRARGVRRGMRGAPG